MAQDERQTYLLAPVYLKLDVHDKSRWLAHKLGMSHNDYLRKVIEEGNQKMADELREGKINVL